MEGWSEELDARHAAAAEAAAAEVLSCKLAEAEGARSFAEEEAARARGAAAQLEAWEI